MAKNESKATKKEVNKNKKSFMKDFKAELKKVIWPTPKQLVNNTVAVLTIVLITSVLVFVLDLVFRGMDEYGILKIKEAVTSLDSSSEDNEEEATQDDGTDATTDATVQTDETTSESTENTGDGVEVESTDEGVVVENGTEATPAEPSAE